MLFYVLQLMKTRDGYLETDLERAVWQRASYELMLLLELPAGADFPLRTMADVDSMNEKLCESMFMSAVVSLHLLFT